MDNFIDYLLPNSSNVIRPQLFKDEKFTMTIPPIAEHGFSALIQIFNNNNENERIINDHNSSKKNNDTVFLFDTGVSEKGVIHNAKALGINLVDIDTIILSHGHFDHFSGIYNILKEIRLSSSKIIDIYVHPDAFLKRWEIHSNGKKAKMPFLEQKKLEMYGINLHKNNDHVFLPNKYDKDLLITGRIPRETSFEKGYPVQYKEDQCCNKKLIPDPMVDDDQAVIINVKGKGLIILTGCGHSGIINTIRHAKKLTGIDKIYAVLGGFHLPADGNIYEQAIEPTLMEIKENNPRYVIPCHCTGWKATNKIIDMMPEKFIQSSVGTIFTF